MSSVKSRKVSLFVIRSIVALAGVLMIAFQNCSRVNTLEISDIAGKAVLGNEFSGNNNTEDVNVQIEQGDGTTISVDHVGNETVVVPSNNNPSSNNNSNSGNNSSDGNSQVPVVVADPVVVIEQPVVVVQPVVVDKHEDDDDSNDLDVCLPEEQKLKDDKNTAVSKQQGVSHRNTLASYQKMRCKKSKKDKKYDGPRCLDLIQGNGIVVIDIAKLDNVSKITSIKGKTLIYSSNPEITSTRSLIIDNAVGKTILCGIIISRLDIKKGILELREGAQIKSCGEIKGHVYKDDESSIDGSLGE